MKRRTRYSLQQVRETASGTFRRGGAGVREAARARVREAARGARVRGAAPRRRAGSCAVARRPLLIVEPAAGGGGNGVSRPFSAKVSFGFSGRFGASPPGSTQISRSFGWFSTELERARVFARTFSGRKAVELPLHACLCSATWSRSCCGLPRESFQVVFSLAGCFLFFRLFLFWALI